MGKFWKFWFLSGITSEYVDLDFRFWKLRGHIHLVYGDRPVCMKNHDSWVPEAPTPRM